ncbi:hypothetical protein SLS62_003602 [Diatrype stigma]|uniref:F-box domain-containing protein n=1 Tax=Diatrype stigma TaxID=117547 RepID=A0AAN9YU23_9PEZI
MSLPNLHFLPPEILHDIVLETMSDGFESLMLSCRTIYARGGCYITTHNALRKKWSHIVVGYSHWHSQRGHPWMGLKDLIYTISRDAIIAGYIKSVKFEFKPDTVPGPVPEGHWVRDEAELEELKAFVRGSKYLQRAGVDVDGWVAKMFAERPARIYPAHTTTFLMTLLEGVESLEFDAHLWQNGVKHASVECRSELSEVIELVARDTRRPNKQGGSCALSKLRVLRTTGLQPVKYGPHPAEVGWGSLASLLALENLEELALQHPTSVCYRPDPFQDRIMGSFSWPYPELSSNLRRLELVWGRIPEFQIGSLLAHTPRLESLKYVHHDNREHPRPGWDAGAFVAEVGKHCGDRLTDLHIECDHFDRIVTRGVVSMREFTRLRTVWLGGLIFCGAPYVAGSARSHSRDDARWDLSTLHPLTKILPPSVTRLCLEVGDYIVLSLGHNHLQPPQSHTWLVLAPLISGFAKNRATCLPQLEQFVVRCRQPYQERQGHEEVRAARAAAEAEGVVFRRILGLPRN